MRTAVAGVKEQPLKSLLELDGILGGDPTSTAKSPVDTSEGTEVAERRPNPEDEVIDEEVELDEDVELPAGSTGGADTQEQFSTPEVLSQSQQFLSGEQEAGDETLGPFSYTLPRNLTLALTFGVVSDSDPDSGSRSLTPTFRPKCPHPSLCSLFLLVGPAEDGPSGVPCTPGGICTV
ncbi:hypothetical protein UY3_16249 [Chelonia mydas]|uniref:Uncharacterized protein n=1 Tax=Chelonia mydas TaxID=8469 RepID=M7AN58_CHEMY|nr:hypothetical protein UY3_16249 [Chelonia mydas]